VPDHILPQVDRCVSSRTNPIRCLPANLISKSAAGARLHVDGICILANYSEQFALSDAARDILLDLCLSHWPAACR
jgi:hypothetical protein